MKIISRILIAIIVLFLADLLVLNPCFMKLSAYSHDEMMGWIPKRDFSRNYTQKDFAGNKYHAAFSLDHNRFRMYGNPSSRLTKILFVGDSFTGDPYVGNNEMYFSVVKSVLHDKYHKDVEIFAAGGGGYGTLQEYLLIKNQIHIIKPDIFVLQFCENDLYNNLLSWERQGIVRSQCFLRPYYSAATGEIIHASSTFARCYRFFYTRSFIFRRIDSLVQNIQYKYYGDYFQNLPPQEHAKLEESAFDVTEKLLVLLKNELGQHPKLFIMLDQNDDKHLDELNFELAKETGFTPLVTHSKNLDRLEDQGVVVRHADGGHLNITGNRIWGEGLASDLLEHLNSKGQEALHTTP